MAGAKGLLLVKMEPPPPLDAEFNDWYDQEHIPERASIDGFHNARRFVCIDGWPRYMALYDLEHADVLHTPEYMRYAGTRYSPWTQRIQSRVRGFFRGEGEQLYPGHALFGDQGPAPRVVLWRFGAMPESAAARLVPGLRAIYEGRHDTAQLRVFRTRDGDRIGHAAVVEARLPRPPESIDLGHLGAAAAHVEAFNTYVPWHGPSTLPGGKA